MVQATSASRLIPNSSSGSAEFGFDVRLLPDELAGSRAWARALAKAGVFSAPELASVEQALDTIAGKAAPNAADFPGVEDVHHFVEQELVSLIGDTGYKLHTGRSRNEQIATDLRLYIRARSTPSFTASPGLLRLRRQGRLKDAVMPSYTHMQRAEPVLVAHWLLAYVEMFCATPLAPRLLRRSTSARSVPAQSPAPPRTRSHQSPRGTRL